MPKSPAERKATQEVKSCLAGNVRMIMWFLFSSPALGGVKVLYTVTFNETGRKEDFELGDDVRAEDLLSLTLDGVKDDYTVMTIGGPVIGGVGVPSVIRVKKVRK